MTSLAPGGASDSNLPPEEAALRLELQLLGGFAVRAAGRAVDGFESRKVRAVLAYLALQESRAIGRERLAEVFWPEVELERARRNLRQVLYNLRGALGSAGRCLVVDAREARLAAAGVAVDALRFEAAAREGLAGRGPAALAALVRALELYRGELLAGLVVSDAEAWNEWREGEAQRLRELAMAAAREALRRAEADGLHETALGFARRLGGLDPLSEESCRARMRVLARLGRRAQALAEYGGFVRRLAEELEVGPGEELRGLRAAILAEQELPGSDADRPGPTGPIVPLVGRESAWLELGRVWSEVRSGASRITLILGGRGSGKSRLVRSFLFQALAGRSGAVLLARGCPGERDALRGLLADALASLPVELVGAGSPELAAAVAGAVRALPEVRERRHDLPAADGTRPAPPERAFAKLLREMAKARRPGSAGRGTPIVLFVDDLEGSPEVFPGLVELRRAVGAASVWIVAAVRTEELAGEALRSLRASAAAIGSAPIELGALGREDVARATRTLIAPHGSEELAEGLYRASQGVPLALAEAVNLLADSSALRQEPGGAWALADSIPAAAGLPVGAEGLIDRRLELLPRTSRRLLGLAAVMGERFDTPTLLEVEGEHPKVLEAALQILIERWMVRPHLMAWAAHRRDRDLAIWQAGARRGPFEFAQRTVRDRLVASIDPKRRRLLEAEIARARARLESGHPAGRTPT